MVKKGDVNTSFFHLYATIRKQRDQILAIKLENNNWSYDPTIIENYFSDNFKDLYKSTNLEVLDDLEDLITPVILVSEKKIWY